MCVWKLYVLICIDETSMLHIVVLSKIINELRKTLNVFFKEN